MAHKQGSLYVEHSRRGNLRRFRMVHSGPAGKQTVARMTTTTEDKDLLREKVSAWLVQSHRRIRHKADTSSLKTTGEA